MLPIHEASFDGTVLSLQMSAPSGTSQADVPYLVMTVVGEKLLGRSQQAGMAIGPALKLVRAHGV